MTDNNTITQYSNYLLDSLSRCGLQKSDKALNAIKQHVGIAYLRGQTNTGTVNNPVDTEINMLLLRLHLQDIVEIKSIIQECLEKVYDEGLRMQAHKIKMVA